MMVLVSLLRGVNVGGHGPVKMDALRTLYESLGMRDVRTYIQSGNVVFRTQVRDPAAIARRIADGMVKTFGASPEIIVRTAAELKSVIARNPFEDRRGIDPAKLLVLFLAAEPAAEARAKARALETGEDELRLDGREAYVYFPNGMGRPKLQPAMLERALKVPGTGRNWNTVRKLLAMAEELEG